MSIARYQRHWFSSKVTLNISNISDIKFCTSPMYQAISAAPIAIQINADVKHGIFFKNPNSKSTFPFIVGLANTDATYMLIEKSKANRQIDPEVKRALSHIVNVPLVQANFIEGLTRNTHVKGKILDNIAKAFTLSKLRCGTQKSNYFVTT